MSNKVEIEVCLDNAKSVDTLKNIDIDRIEICSSLGVDGLTPSLALVEYVKKNSHAERHVMIRSRPGDFVYSNVDIDIMIRDINLIANVGVHGIVFGVLDNSNNIDIPKTKRIVSYAKHLGLKTTFHRAIDLTTNYMKSIEQCIDLGIDRILTSGGCKTVCLGLPTIAKAVKKYKNKINISVGGGVDLDNLPKLIYTDVDGVHFSGSSEKCLYSKFPIFEKASLSYKIVDKKKIDLYISAVRSHML